MPTILPTTSSGAERRLDESTDNRLAKIPRASGTNGLISSLYNPDTITPELLSVLAYALSVDRWDAEWSDDSKREVLREAAELHRIKGTDQAVIGALATAGIYVQIRHWYEADGASWPTEFQANGNPLPFTMVIIINSIAAGAQAHQTKKIIENNKRASVHYQVITQASSQGDIYVTVGGVWETLGRARTRVASDWTIVV
ncbi:phage tail protein I [Candidatus Persebacteraceae bacterium Df01]|jgi:phage tail P2-like protein|uniref:Phage tail protein I n=1 Tax=Candidatus Doriopsillibacter californiensis TaxID=2970740 RepID=A0ABT7QLV3_9GAMM|nr:phage tail protein I [Candidatus Persebacteraceae bacterium Df01]